MLNSLFFKQPFCLYVAGHSDVVRVLVPLSSTRFLSAANDSTIRLWNIDSEAAIAKFHSIADHYIYTFVVNFDFIRLLKTRPSEKNKYTFSSEIKKAWCYLPPFLNNALFSASLAFKSCVFCVKFCFQNEHERQPHRDFRRRRYDWSLETAGWCQGENVIHFSSSESSCLKRTSWWKRKIQSFFKFSTG